MKKLLILIFVFFGCFPVGQPFGAQPDAGVFLQAQQAYKSGDYAAAADLYEKMIADGFVNGHMYYDLGNACLKKGAVGRAILNFRMAERFMPRDADLEANLQYALDRTQDKIDCSDTASVSKTFFFWFYKFSSREFCYAFLAFNCIVWILLTIKFFFRKEALGIAIPMAVFFTLLFGSSFAVKYYQEAYGNAAVVLPEMIQVRSGSSPSDTVLFRLHEGAELAIAGEENGWVKIELCDGKKGWVQKTSIGILPGA